MAKPKIGILSMQRVINYGSFLQAYALREILRQNGAGDVSFIDIKPGKPLISNTIGFPSWKRLLLKVTKLIKTGNTIRGIKDFLFGRRLKKSIIKAWPILELDNPKDSSEFDCVVIGSDEVFNCCQETYWGYTTQLYGDIPANQAKRVISYAGTFGNSRLEDLEKFKVSEEIGQLMQHLSAISVRDQNSLNIVTKLTGRKAQIHLDPVLIYGFKKEIKAMPERPFKKKYMVVYTYQGRMNKPEEIEGVRFYARQNGLKLISIFCRYDWCDVAVVPHTPIEVLRWFRHAECIVTDTFHGTIFSIITHSRFASFIRPSNKNKLNYLLERLQLTDHAVDNTTHLSEVLAIHIDSTNIDNILSDNRNHASAFLQANVPL